MPRDEDLDENFGRADTVSEPFGSPAASLLALNARVAELERTVALLLGQRGPAIASNTRRIDRDSVPSSASPAFNLPANNTHAAEPQATPTPAPTPAPAPVPPLVAPEPPPPVPAPGRRPASLEDRLGSQIFNLIGIIAIIVGTSWALKLAIEHGLIGPVARVVLGLAVGAAAVLWSERFRRRGYAAFSYTLKAVGSGVLYLVLWAALQIYHLLPAPAVLAAMLLVTAWNAWMAWAQDAELLAAYALAGGLATPVLLSTGGNHETFLFTYLTAIDAATVLLVRAKPWPRLLLPAWLATVAYFIGWYAQFFNAAPPRAFTAQSAETGLFALLFAALFALVSLRGWRPQSGADLSTGLPEATGLPGTAGLPGSTGLPGATLPPSSTASAVNSLSSPDVPGSIENIFLPLANAVFLALALYSVFQDSGLHAWLAWLMVALAALYLGLVRLQRTSVSAALHLATAVVLLTAAIPLKASGHTLTTAWLVEGLVLYWVGLRFASPARRTARNLLPVLAAAAFVLGLGSLAVHGAWFASSVVEFFTASLASALIAFATLAGVVWLSRPGSNAAPSRKTAAAAALLAVDLVALLLVSRDLTGQSMGPAFLNAGFALALLALAALAVACWAGYRVRPPAAQELLQQNRDPLHLVAGATLVLFNLVAIVTFGSEIYLLFPQTSAADALLERSLALSGFLMIYGAALLAVGFWRRSAFVRWQALILLVFTILKVFLSDISGLSQGYRVVSFLALGALLLGVSFAYQKDWLGLRNDPVPPAGNQP